jgi:cell division protein FtsX
VIYRTPAEALAEFKRVFAAYSALTANVTADALPASFHLRLSSADAFDRVAAVAESQSGVNRATLDLSDVAWPAAGLGAFRAVLHCQNPIPSLSP